MGAETKICILKRLVSSGEVIQSKPPSGGAGYIWASAVEETHDVATTVA